MQARHTIFGKCGTLSRGSKTSKTSSFTALTHAKDVLTRSDGNAAVDVDAVPGDVERARVQGEVLHEARDLLGLAEAAHRNVPMFILTEEDNFIQFLTFG